MPEGATRHYPDSDLWAPVDLSVLRRELVDAWQTGDWQQLKAELRSTMDSLATDGPLGRALLHVVRGIPAGVDPLLDRYRAAVALDYGDWDVLADCLARGVSQASEVRGLRDIATAPVSQTAPPSAHDDAERRLFEANEWEMERSERRFLRWARRMQTFDAAPRLTRDDVAIARHLRYRALHHAWTNARGELWAGRLPVAVGFAREAQRAGDVDEPLREVSTDLAALGLVALGESNTAPRARFPERNARATGMSPFGTWQVTTGLMPLMAVADHEYLAWAVPLAEEVALRLASPRAQLQSLSWRLARQLVAGSQHLESSELRAALSHARQASPGLRALPQLIDGIVRGDAASLGLAARLARRAGVVWMQLSALTWVAALAPRMDAARALTRLLRASGWRRIPLVSATGAADAALGLVAAQQRDAAIVELAVASGRGNAIVEVARAHLWSSERAAAAAVSALSSLPIATARALLRERANGADDVARNARRALTQSANALSDREVEVIELAGRGLTNREIADRLVLSEHTIARHLANARAKLGASTRLEAVRKLESLSSVRAAKD